MHTGFPASWQGDIVTRVFAFAKQVNYLFMQDLTPDLNPSPGVFIL